jgi:HPt (histidine-containing phosphotransfer) domain-containing protein
VNEPGYELAHLLEVVDSDAELARLVAAQFLAQGNRLPERLAAALAAQQPVAAARVAHEIKGMAAMLGAQRLAAAALVIERTADAAPSLAALNDEWACVVRCLSAYMSDPA